AYAGNMYLYMVVDPATTAGAGVAASGSFSVQSNRSGSGTWQLYAVDDIAGSFGIAQVKAQLTGTTPIITNRVTQTLYDTDDDSGDKAGFTLLRSANNANPVTASQELPGSQPFFVGGFGITAGNYTAALSAQSPTGFSGTTNGQWGNYSSSNAATQGNVNG